MSTLTRRADIAKEIKSVVDLEQSGVEQDLRFLHQAFQLFDERLEHLEPQERRAVVAVLSSRIRDTLAAVQHYVEGRLADRKPTHRAARR